MSDDSDGTAGGFFEVRYHDPMEKLDDSDTHGRCIVGTDASAGCVIDTRTPRPQLFSQENYLYVSRPLHI